MDVKKDLKDRQNVAEWLYNSNAPKHVMESWEDIVCRLPLIYHSYDEIRYVDSTHKGE